jgi:hypothetical protein
MMKQFKGEIVYNQEVVSHALEKSIFFLYRVLRGLPLEEPMKWDCLS